MSAQLAKRFFISWRYSAADNRCRRGRKCWAMGPYADRKRWACPGDLTPCMRYSRCRVGRCECSHRLLSYRLWRCSTPEQRAKELLRGLLLAPALHQHVEHIIVL